MLSVADQVPKNAQGTLRHASSDITIDIYTHAQDDAKRKQWSWMVCRQAGINGAIRSPGIPSGSPVIQHKTQSRETPQVAANLSGPRLAACEVGVTAETTLFLALALESRRASRSEGDHLVGLIHVGPHALREVRIKFGGVFQD